MLSHLLTVHPHTRGELFFAAIVHGWLPVHPHTRGELHQGCTLQHIQLGSPPHTWGTRYRRGQDGRRGRFTPTHVGNSIWLRDNWCMQPGSPPHTWGTRKLLYDIGQILRFTPTHVGNSKEHGLSYISPSVHPHTRGELHRAAMYIDPSPGSPPHTWGTQKL